MFASKCGSVLLAIIVSVSPYVAARRVETLTATQDEEWKPQRTLGALEKLETFYSKHQQGEPQSMSKGDKQITLYLTIDPTTGAAFLCVAPESMSKEDRSKLYDKFKNDCSEYQKDGVLSGFDPSFMKIKKYEPPVISPKGTRFQVPDRGPHVSVYLPAAPPPFGDKTIVSEAKAKEAEAFFKQIQGQTYEVNYNPDNLAFLMGAPNNDGYTGPVIVVTDMPKARELVDKLRESAGLPSLEEARMTHMSLCTIGSREHVKASAKISVPNDRGLDRQLREHLNKWPKEGKMHKKLNSLNEAAAVSYLSK